MNPGAYAFTVMPFLLISEAKDREMSDVLKWLLILAQRLRVTPNTELAGAVTTSVLECLNKERAVVLSVCRSGPVRQM